MSRWKEKDGRPRGEGSVAGGELCLDSLGEPGTGAVMEAKRSSAEADRLSSLPAELRDEILVRLDLRDAVRTSVLSRAWRDLWKSLSALSLSFPSGTHPSVVDSVLLPYIGPHVSLFDICVDDASAGRVDDWIVALSRCSVESIRMRGQLRSGNDCNLHSSIFSLGDLVSLRLGSCNIPPLPVGFAGFPALQELELNSVTFPDNGDKQLEAIIRRSPLLHTLDLFDVCIVDDYPESVIEAPNLRTLSIYSAYDYGWRIGELPCLEFVNIDVLFCPQHEHNFGDFLARFAHVQELSLFVPGDDVKMPHTLPFTFYNLKKLTLALDFTEPCCILFLFTLLRSCHNLQNLDIESRDNSGESYEADWEFLISLWTDGMCADLQIVRMSRIIFIPNEISFMKLMLSKARCLRTLYVDAHPDDFDDPIVVDLLKCKRASAQACILFEGLVQHY